jgi:aminopeptidase N
MNSALFVLVAAAANKPLHIDHYDAELSIDTLARSIHGEETITVATDAPELRLAASALAIRSVTRDGAPLPFRREGETLIVALAGATAAPLRIHLSYDVGPSPSLVFAQDQVFVGYNTSSWLASNSELSDPSTLTLSLLVDANLTTVSIGEPQTSQAVANGKRRDIWKTTTPTSIFLFAFAVGNFHHVETIADGLQLHYYSVKRSDAELARIFETTPKILHNFYDITQTPLPAKTYRQVLVDGNIAQEAAGMALIGEDYATAILEDPMEDWVIAHELAHQFYGVALQMGNWADFWLNEGFATFMTAVDKERRYGAAEYAREIALALKRMDKAESRGRDHALVVSGWKIPEDASGAVAYSKGALFLHTLRTTLGDKAFFSRIARYTKMNIGRQVSTRDLAEVMDREPLFQRWAFSNQAVATAEPLSVALSADLVITQLGEGIYRAAHVLHYPANASVMEVADGILLVCDALYSREAASLLWDWLDVRFGKWQVVAIDTHNDRIGGMPRFSHSPSLCGPEIAPTR